MIAGSVRKISLVALLVAAAAMLAPSSANAAAPQVYCIVAYGHENPGNCDPQPDLNDPPYAGRIYPTSQPYGYGEKGLLFVEGHTDSPASVLVSVTDGVSTLSRRVEANAAGEFKADLKVTELGVHEGTGPNPNGISVLTVTVVATVAAVDSAVATTTIDKYAIAPGDQGLAGKDKYRPTFPAITRGSTTTPNPQYPPGSWNHLTGTGNIVIPGVVTIGNGSNGTAVIRGLVEDDYAAAYGHASEIASVKVKITQGTTLIQDFGNVANRVNSTQAKFDIVVNINDFEPSFPMSDVYTVTIEVKDANGNTVTVTGTFDVMPF